MDFEGKTLFLKAAASTKYAKRTEMRRYSLRGSCVTCCFHPPRLSSGHHSWDLSDFLNKRGARYCFILYWKIWCRLKYPIVLNRGIPGSMDPWFQGKRIWRKRVKGPSNWDRLCRSPVTSLAFKYGLRRTQPLNWDAPIVQIGKTLCLVRIHY